MCIRDSDEDKLASLAQRDENGAMGKTSVPKKEENIDNANNKLSGLLGD